MPKCNDKISLEDIHKGDMNSDVVMRDYISDVVRDFSLTFTVCLNFLFFIRNSQWACIHGKCSYVAAVSLLNTLHEHRRFIKY